MSDTGQGFTFEGNGTLERIDTFTSKAGKDILTLVVRVGGQYPQLIPFKVFGRLVEDAAEWKPGSELRITGRLGGRDWNGKVYGDNVANSIKVLGFGSAKEPQPSPSSESSEEDMGLPF